MTEDDRVLVNSPRIPGVRNAQLPAIYVEAKNALSQCSRVDECKEWADKAAAIASYAKQAQDKTLMDTAQRIRARAVRRCGELLKQIEKGQGNRTDRLRTAGGTKSQAAKDAGLSRRQKVDALRVASLPEADFESAVESGSPATITELSEAGKREAAARHERLGPKPPGFREATRLLGILDSFAAFCKQTEPGLVASGLRKREAKRALRDLETINAWTRKLKKEANA